MRFRPLPILLASIPFLAFAGTPALTLLAPAEGATVPLLTDNQKAFLDMPRAERIAAFADTDFRKRLRAAGHHPAPVHLAWRCEPADGVRPVFSVTVYRLPERTPVFRADTTATELDVDNLEIARDYEWTVHANALEHAVATGRFRTEDRAPRLLRVPGVPNVRDLGGRIGLDGRRVRQGLVMRSAGLNENASPEYYTREEALKRAADPEGLLSEEGALKEEVARLRDFQANPGSMTLHSVPISRTWTVFRVAMGEKEFRAACPAALRTLEAVPAEFLGAVPETATLDEKGFFAFPDEVHRQANGPAVFLQAVDAPEDGWISLGCGADWWWALLVNGEVVFDCTTGRGNDRDPISPLNHVFPVPVRKGRNLVAAVVVAGSAGWRWCCLAAPPVPVATLLDGKISNDEKRLDSLFRVRKRTKPGATRISDANRPFFLDTLGIRTDIDLRSDSECYGMKGSPLGADVAWVHVSSASYAGMQREAGREAFAKVFRVFLDPASYPIDFHCIAGQDRTGAVAFILNALLGVDEEELYRDWESTGFWNKDPNFNHARLFSRLYHGFDDYPGETIRERVEAYVLSLGFTDADIATLRSILLEPAG